MKIDITKIIEADGIYFGDDYSGLLMSPFLESIMRNVGMDWYKDRKVFKDRNTGQVFLEQEDKYVFKYIGDEYLSLVG